MPLKERLLHYRKTQHTSATAYNLPVSEPCDALKFFHI
jgi:hypothetical protein